MRRASSWNVALERDAYVASECNTIFQKGAILQILVTCIKRGREGGREGERTAGKTSNSVCKYDIIPLEESLVVVVGKQFG